MSQNRKILADDDILKSLHRSLQCRRQLQYACVDCCRHLVNSDKSMFTSELDHFVGKFLQLKKAELEPPLELEKPGSASVSS